MDAGQMGGVPKREAHALQAHLYQENENAEALERTVDVPMWHGLPFSQSRGGSSAQFSCSLSEAQTASYCRFHSW